MIYIDRNSEPIPSIFSSEQINNARIKMDEFYILSLDKKRQIRPTRLWEISISAPIKDALRNLFKHKCAYCESFIAPANSIGYIDHFRPKGGARGLNKDFSSEHYFWLTYEWRNIYYSCEICDRYKSSWFPVEGYRINENTTYEETITKEIALLVDPCNNNPEEHFVYDEKGVIDFLTLQGKTTIEILKLNRQELVEARIMALREPYSQWELFIKLFRREKTNRGKLKKIAEEWESLLNENSETAYLGIQRFMLLKWISNHPEIQEYLRNKSFNDIQIEEKVYAKRDFKSIENFQIKEHLNIAEKQFIEEKLSINLLKHIYIDKIEIGNFKCFSDIEINFKKEINNIENDISDGNPVNEPWLLFLGENGVGKSSLLKAIAIGLSGNEYLKTLEIKGSDILKHNTVQGHIKIYLVGEEKPITVYFNENEIHSSIELPLVNLAAYNSIRLNYKKGKLIPERNKFENVKVKNLFNHTYSLIDSDSWLIKQLKKSQSVFDRVALTLKDLMILDEKDRIEYEGEKIVIKRGKETLLIEELSDGYQAVYALAVDIMATFAGENSSFDLVEGMVLIDEIGTHLHPRWRMEVVERLRKAFPKIQFVVTTHEPLCLRGLRSGETIVLIKDENKQVVAITDLPNPSELRVDQILTSEFFGLKSTFDTKTEKLFDEYYAILALDDHKRNQTQNKRFMELRNIIPKIKHLGDNLREEIIYYVVDELLAKKTRNDGMKIRETLKDEAVKRVQSIWSEKESNN